MQNLGDCGSPSLALLCGEDIWNEYLKPMCGGDTIFALSSGTGPAGVAVIRISGPAAGTVINRMAGPRAEPRRAAYRKVCDPETGAGLDEGLVLWFTSPKSETGEDMAELQVHGGRAVVRAILDAIAKVPGCRLAEPGEFARRAFESGKLDLTQVEGLADLVNAETDAQRRQALAQAGGVLAKLYDGWRAELIGAMALAEAAIDFSDEGDVGANAFASARTIIARLSQEIRDHLHDNRRGEILRDGFQVVLAGPPNVGKSSLLNALARRDAAIVSEHAGTTRDVIDVRLDLDGIPVLISDTAGVRESVEAIEQEGIRRTLDRARRADLVLWLSEPAAEYDPVPKGLIDQIGPFRRVVTKGDLMDAAARAAIPAGALEISSTTGEGIAELAAWIAGEAANQVGHSEAPALTQARHRQNLELALGSLDDFLRGLASETELRAEDLRRAAHALGRITGRVDVEDVLDQIFGRFCIGK